MHRTKILRMTNQFSWINCNLPSCKKNTFFFYKKKSSNLLLWFEICILAPYLNLFSCSGKYQNTLTKFVIFIFRQILFYFLFLFSILQLIIYFSSKEIISSPSFNFTATTPTHQERPHRSYKWCMSMADTASASSI